MNCEAGDEIFFSWSCFARILTGWENRLTGGLNGPLFLKLKQKSAFGDRILTMALDLCQHSSQVCVKQISLQLIEEFKQLTSPLLGETCCLQQ